MSVEKYPAMAISKGTENLDFYPHAFTRHLSVGGRTLFTPFRYKQTQNNQYLLL